MNTDPVHDTPILQFPEDVVDSVTKLYNIMEQGQEEEEEEEEDEEQQEVQTQEMEEEEEDELELPEDFLHEEMNAINDLVNATITKQFALEFA
jgi:hypothetical protein